ncbi:MAG: beta-ketoacyl synthase N-terminal-like domain-containing protein [Pseudomonadota bacterium]|nr:beta-ketoacyl synthase N-terminal-like domain-containing protein [Pseudomonadota bacterium]
MTLLSGHARAGVLAVGLVTPIGDELRAVLGRVRAGETAVRAVAHLSDLPDGRAAVVEGPSLAGWLKRKKDARLLPRAAELALPAAGRALLGFTGDPEELGLCVAVGREPPDEGEAEASLAAMARDGALDRELLGGPGRALYPPLLPLRTLPNMVLAHVAIQHGIRGENGTWAGGAEAGAQALRAALRLVDEGRVPYCLVGAAASAVDLASARDRLRLGHGGPPGEAAIFALIGPGGTAVRDDPSLTAAMRAAIGDCGAVEGLYGVLGG